MLCWQDFRVQSPFKFQNIFFLWSKVQNTNGRFKTLLTEGKGNWQVIQNVYSHKFLLKSTKNFLMKQYEVSFEKRDIFKHRDKL